MKVLVSFPMVQLPKPLMTWLWLDKLVLNRYHMVLRSNWGGCPSFPPPHTHNSRFQNFPHKKKILSASGYSFSPHKTQGGMDLGGLAGDSPGQVLFCLLCILLPTCRMTRVWLASVIWKMPESTSSLISDSLSRLALFFQTQVLYTVGVMTA